MELYQNNFFHIYNRSNNYEKVFKEKRNYFFFLEKYHKLLNQHLETIAYCLMPTHFHFLVKITSDDMVGIKNKIGILLSSYTKAINKAYNRHGGLFQSHTKARQIDQENRLIKIISYIHQNPLRANLVDKLEDWDFSSYRDFLDPKGNAFCNKQFIFDLFGSKDEFIRTSEELVKEVDKKYWV